MRISFLMVFTSVLLAACGAPANTAAFPTEMNVVYDDSGEPVRLGEIVSTTEVLKADQAVAGFDAVKVDKKCRMPRASHRAKVAYVHTYGGHNDVPIHHVEASTTSWENTAQRAMTRQMIKEMAGSSFRARMMANEFAQMQLSNQLESPGRVEVLVTETEAPVFLYLSSYNSVLWNIQLAPGAALDGIVVDAYEGGVIANGAPANRTGFRVFSEINGVRCRTKTHGRPTPVDVRIASAKELNPNVSLGSYPEQWEQEHKAARKFFSRTLPKLAGKAPEWLLYDARGGSFKAVLVGPKPAEPFVPQPIERLQIPESFQPFWGTRRQALDYFGLKLGG